MYYSYPLEAIKRLHAPMNGPYDDVACTHCTELVNLVTQVAEINEPLYIEYPCMTMILAGEQ